MTHNKDPPHAVIGLETRADTFYLCGDAEETPVSVTPVGCPDVVVNIPNAASYSKQLEVIAAHVRANTPEGTSPANAVAFGKAQVYTRGAHQRIIQCYRVPLKEFDRASTYEMPSRSVGPIPS